MVAQSFGCSLCILHESCSSFSPLWSHSTLLTLMKLCLRHNTYRGVCKQISFGLKYCSDRNRPPIFSAIPQFRISPTALQPVALKVLACRAVTRSLMTTSMFRLIANLVVDLMKNQSPNWLIVTPQEAFGSGAPVPGVVQTHSKVRSYLGQKPIPELDVPEAQYLSQFMFS